MACELCGKKFGEPCETACLTAANIVLQEKNNRFRGTLSRRCWPMKSDAAGCMSHEVEEATRQAKKFGVPTEFTKAGQAIFTSADHRRKYLKLRGWRDKHSYI